VNNKYYSWWQKMSIFDKTNDLLIVDDFENVHHVSRDHGLNKIRFRWIVSLPKTGRVSGRKQEFIHYRKRWDSQRKNRERLKHGIKLSLKHRAKFTQGGGGRKFLTHSRPSNRPQPVYTQPYWIFKPHINPLRASSFLTAHQHIIGHFSALQWCEYCDKSVKI